MVHCHKIFSTHPPSHFLHPHIHSSPSDIQKVFVDKTECLAAIKRYRGSRFKAFRTYEEALKFSETRAAVIASHGVSGEEGAVTPQPTLNVEKPSPFRGPKSQDLVKFRKSIEKGDTNYFSKVSCSFFFFWRVVCVFT